jgi:Protein of unknown function DUF262
MVDFEVAEEQIRTKQREVDFDTKEFTIEFLVEKFNKGDIYVPDYQRNFVWDNKRKSRFIESLLLGLPIPSIFLADVYGNDDKEGELEIVDGSQRIRTLAAFVGNELVLSDLEVLTSVNGKTFNDFALPRKKRFLNISLKTTVLSDKSDSDTRFMMFDRVNTGGDELKSMEQRRGIYQGKFTDLIYTRCSQNELFKKLTFFTEKVGLRNEAEELILRFFAYSDKYLEYTDNSQADFLNVYLNAKNSEEFNESEYYDRFVNMLRFIDINFPERGFLKSKDSQKTPRVRFEALSVGVDLALKEKKRFNKIDVSWADSEEFNKMITGSNTSSATKVRARVEYVKTKILEKL